MAMRYAEFWPRYLDAHADPRTRALHYIGTLGAAALLALAAASLDWRWMGAALLVGYRCPPGSATRCSNATGPRRLRTRPGR